MSIEASFGLASRSGATPSVDFAGRWKNQHGSSMELTVDGQGSVRGRFRTAVGVPSPGDAYPLCGFVQGDLIAFSVSFAPHDSVTAWAGQHTIVGGRERIESLWHLAKNIPDEDEARGLWSGILAGSDVFERA